MCRRFSLTVLIMVVCGMQAYHPSPSFADAHLRIDSVSPDHGKAGDFVTITGHGFGLAAADSRVTIGGVPVAVTQVTFSAAGEPILTVQLDDDTVSGWVSVRVGDQLASSAGTFCVQPAIKYIQPTLTGGGAILEIQGSNFDPEAMVFAGDVPLLLERIKTARRPHRFDATRVLTFVQADAQSTFRIENRCPDGRVYVDTNAAAFLHWVKQQREP